MNYPWIAILLLSLLSTGCTSRMPPEQSMTQLQIRQLQTHEFATLEPRELLKAMVDVLQDDGFIITVAQPEIGLLSATKEIDIEKRSERLLAQMSDGAEARWKKQQRLDLTAHINSFGSGTRIRVNLHKKLLDNNGNAIVTERILEPSVYEDLFHKIGKSLFIQESGL